MLKKLAMVLAVVALTACGGAQEEQTEVKTGELRSAESELVQCGYSCPSGYHPESYLCGSSCGFCSGSTNAVNCQPNSGTFLSCGYSCPSGWHPTSYRCSSSCGSSCSGSSNSVICEPDTTSFASCGYSCPSGWRVTSYTCNYSCGTSCNNSVTCVKN